MWRFVAAGPLSRLGMFCVVWRDDGSLSGRESETPRDRPPVLLNRTCLSTSLSITDAFAPPATHRNTSCAPATVVGQKKPAYTRSAGRDAREPVLWAGAAWGPKRAGGAPLPPSPSLLLFFFHRRGGHRRLIPLVNNHSPLTAARLTLSDATRSPIAQTDGARAEEGMPGCHFSLVRGTSDKRCCSRATTMDPRKAKDIFSDTKNSLTVSLTFREMVRHPPRARHPIKLETRRDEVMKEAGRRGRRTRVWRPCWARSRRARRRVALRFVSPGLGFW